MDNLQPFYVSNPTIPTASLILRWNEETIDDITLSCKTTETPFSF
jgi:hypothetical protein